MVLVEKDWLSFGHMFRHRSGHLNSEKWFSIENDRGGGDRSFGDAASAGKAIENAFLSAKGFFNRDNASRDSLPDSDGESGFVDADIISKKSVSRPRSPVEDIEVTKTKELSPVFHQFLDATYQLQHQHPTRFEFNERFLRRLLYHLYSCQYGTFLYNNEKERVDTKAMEKTRSVWDYFLARREQFVNPKYDPHIDDNKRGNERILFPRTNEVRWWCEVFGRTDAEMNGPTMQGPTVLADRERPVGRPSSVLQGVENAERSLGSRAVSKSPSPKGTATPSGGLSSLSMGISNLGFTAGKAGEQDGHGTSMNRKDMEVEMR
jgi:hypothetical protein